MTRGVGEQKVEDAEEGDFSDVGGLIEDDDDEEEDLLDAGAEFVDQGCGEADGAESGVEAC